MNITSNIIPILVWGFFAVVIAVIVWQKFKGKKAYKNVEFNVDPNWLENSIAAYPADTSKKYYFFHFDKDYLHQGHILEDEQHNTSYEVKVLYNNGLQADETDFINHILNTTHHHRLGKTVTTGVENDNIGTDLKSTFSFDGEDVFRFLKSKGYDYKFRIKGLSYHIDILKNGETVGVIYSSNNGKNLYDRNGAEVTEKVGGKGLYVLECAYADLDAAVLYAVAFTKTEFSLQQMVH